MRAKIGSAFDIFVLSAVILLLFTVGIQIGRGRDTDERHEILLFIEVAKAKGDFASGEGAMIDGKLKADLILLEADQAVIRADAMKTEAGWLIIGGKHVSDNQLIKYYSGESYMEGRVCRILENSGATPLSELSFADFC